MKYIDEIVEEVPFYVSEGYDPNDFEKNLIENEIYVEAFCEK